MGPSSFLLALMASGFNGQSFTFHGYLPIDKEARQKAVRQLERDARQHRQTQIFMETPFRNDALLRDVLSQCSASTLVCVAKDITGPNELIIAQTVQWWRQHLPSLHKIPVVFLLSAS